MIIADLRALWQHMAFTINKLGRNFKQRASGEVFAEWCQNVPKWAGNL